MELDGQPVTAAELIPLALTNFGHFTSMRVEADGTVRGFGLHLDRLVSDSKSTFGAMLDPALVRGYVRQFIDQANGPLALRVTVYDPDLTMGVIGNPARPRVLVTASPTTGMPTTPLRVKQCTEDRDNSVLSDLLCVIRRGRMDVRRSAKTRRQMAVRAQPHHGRRSKIFKGV